MPPLRLWNNLRHPNFISGHPLTPWSPAIQRYIWVTSSHVVFPYTYAWSHYLKTLM